MKPGDTLAHYRIEERLGAGGMGEVFKGIDTKLNRPVAIKVLPPDAVSDPERRARFIREARAASALDHPNIITIHDIAEEEGVSFIVMQYVEGRTLREVIRLGELDLPKKLDLAIQIADGLARAQQEGIVHRDLKPDNVMVTGDARVKILDFGLAKLTEAPESSEEGETKVREAPLTLEGLILGTPAYMSPEQAQGRTVDGRSDIFSFGAVLYELVSGRQAFSGDTTLSILASILRDEPKRVGELSPSIPLDLEKLVLRALRKDPDRRWQSMGDLLVTLKDVRDEMDSGKFVSVAALQGMRKESGPFQVRWAIVGVVALAIAIAVYAILRPTQPPPTTPKPLTSLTGNEFDPALSRDGTKVVFAWNGGDSEEPGLFVHPVVGSDRAEPLRIAAGPIWAPAWSPDGNEIAFTRYVRPREYGIFTVPALGGSERRVGTVWTERGDGLDWSPDGKLLATVDTWGEKGHRAIFLISLETGEKRRFTSPFPDIQPGLLLGDSNPVFSPDGRMLAFLRARVAATDEDIFVKSVEGGEPRRLTYDDAYIYGLDWTKDGESIVFASERGQSDRSRLWRVDAHGGEPFLVGFGENASGVTIAGDALIYSESRGDSDIWRIGGPAAEGSVAAQRLISSPQRDHQPRFSPNGEEIAFVTERMGRSEIWICNSEGDACRSLPNSATRAIWPQWSPDGRNIVFTDVLVSRAPECYVIDVEGGFSPRMVAAGGGGMWSHDGRWIYFTGEKKGIWRVPAAGGKTHQVSDRAAVIVRLSQDGRFVYYSTKFGLSSVFRVPTDGGQDELVLEKEIRFFNSTLWGQSLLYIDDDESDGALVRQIDLETGATTEIAFLGKRVGAGGLSVSPDGKWLLYEKADSNEGANLFVVSNFR